MTNSKKKYKDKYLQLDDLLPILDLERAKGKTIVTTNGSYDILHIGHIRSLKESSDQGDILVVGINSDSSVKQYKGPDRPINTEADRAEFMCAIEFVDYVFIFEETTPIEFLKKIRPDVHTNSNDYGEDCVEAPTLREIGARLYLLKKYEGHSTSAILKKLI